MSIFIRNPAKNDKVWADIQERTDWMVAQEVISREDADQMLKRIYTTNDPADAAKDADLLSESVPEIVSLKEEIFERFNKLCPKHTIFTTNTSTLLPSRLAESTGRPERFLALHTNNPVFITKTADIMGHPGTSKEVLDMTIEFSRRIGLIPIVLDKEQPGYIINTLLVGLMDRALWLVANEVATPQQVDKSWMGTMKIGIGIFGIMDNIGLDVGWELREEHALTSGDEQAKIIYEYLKTNYIDKGHFGRKTGQGFYKYPQPKYENPDFLM
ncbi:MAG: 3-hydroxyacyl-CoA dehydrogenase [Candidatus Lokiarchaeota archaeon]|nr:3-hydroxyacyl-CoA dehydrogenase [Candidatus Lokiarchaeota archaeon]